MQIIYLLFFVYTAGLSFAVLGVYRLLIAYKNLTKKVEKLEENTERKRENGGG
ncbi:MULTISPECIES: hypothetical protein [Lactococcus]|jgi:hypothetical protein|uniref:hypothetical protein n=1 Tax=Lactococcus TaxID=1357 RepID=UPI002078E6D6|nr:hypothetical protein [Lactococcus petauri]USI65302.1 hypothetical protein LMK05_10820 [Lactococcus petauri]USI67797.1 hypothetical protein LMK04_10055 [Lactococcus petauri]WJE12458.1 hypothetical protein QR692_09935 [Lactococcus petauri]